MISLDQYLQHSSDKLWSRSLGRKKNNYNEISSKYHLFILSSATNHWLHSGACATLFTLDQTLDQYAWNVKMWRVILYGSIKRRRRAGGAAARRAIGVGELPMAKLCESRGRWRGWRWRKPMTSFLADRTATQYDRLLASSCCPSVFLSVTLCILTLRVGVQG